MENTHICMHVCFYACIPVHKYACVYITPTLNVIIYICAHVCVHAQSCRSLCNPIDYSPQGSSVHEIPQSRILKWVAISFSRGSSRFRDLTCTSFISCIGSQTFYHCSLYMYTYINTYMYIYVCVCFNHGATERDYLGHI